MIETIISPNDIWGSQERSLMTTFRDRFDVLYGEFESTKQIMLHFSKTLNIVWKKKANLRKSGKLAFMFSKGELSFKLSGGDYLLLTDENIKDNEPMLRYCFFHELAHCLLRHKPSSAGQKNVLADSCTDVLRRALETLGKAQERTANLMAAVLIFYPHKKFVGDSYSYINNLRHFEAEYNTIWELVVQMLMAHGFNSHLFVVDVKSEKFDINFVKEDRSQSEKDFLKNEQGLLLNQTALALALADLKDIDNKSDTDFGVSFRCKAFCVDNNEKILVLGMDNGKYEDTEMLSDLIK